MQYLPLDVKQHLINQSMFLNEILFKALVSQLALRGGTVLMFEALKQRVDICGMYSHRYTTTHMS